MQNWSSQTLTHVGHLVGSAQVTVLPPGRAQLLDLCELANRWHGLSCASCSSAVRALWGGLATLAPPKLYVYGTCSLLVHGLSVVLLRGCLCVGARALLEGCSTVGCCVMQSVFCCIGAWRAPNVIYPVVGLLCLRPHVRSQPRHAWQFRRARSVGPCVRPPPYSAALLSASAAMHELFGSAVSVGWIRRNGRRCFSLTGVVFKPRVGWWPSKTQTKCTSVSGGLHVSGRAWYATA